MSKQNNSQIKAINHYTGPALVLAGPGSGKTYTITRRIKKLITEWEVDPSSILVLTFTKAAAMEMQQRFVGLMPKAGKLVNIGTFHSVYFKIIKMAYNMSAENIIRNERKFEIIADLIKTLEIEVEDEKEFIVDVLSDISAVKGQKEYIDFVTGRGLHNDKDNKEQNAVKDLVKGNGLHYDKADKRRNGNVDATRRGLHNNTTTDGIFMGHGIKATCTASDFKRLFEGYEEKKTKEKLIDFDDMLIMCNTLFREHPEVLKAWQEKFKFILIDEFQDINEIQYENIKMLALPENNLFVVGDDDQSIYKFRGARPEIMFSFEKDFDNCEKILLNINYRSTENIVNTSLKLIGNNTVRFEKKVGTINEKGDDVEIMEFGSRNEQNLQIINEIKKYRKQGVPFSEMAVLFRTNHGSTDLLEKLVKFGIPFSFKDNLANVYEHWIAKDVFSYIRIASGNRERGEFLKILNRPKRYISRDSLKEKTFSFSAIKNYYKDKDWMIERIEKFEFDVRILGTMKNPYAYMNYIRRGIGYDDYVKEYAREHNANESELLGILDELTNSAAQFKTLKEWAVHIRDYGRKLKENASLAQEGVNISTMHGSKGLEYELVIVPDVNEGNIPYEKAVFKDDIEEERRLFYVALTRAKKYLKVYYIYKKNDKKAIPSKFVSELK